MATLRGKRIKMLTLRMLRNAPLDRVAHRFRPFSLLNFVRWYPRLCTRMPTSCGAHTRRAARVIGKGER